MPLSHKEAARLVKGLHLSNKQYFVTAFGLTEEEAEFLLEAWKTYSKGHPREMKNAPLRFLDSFIHGFLAHAEFTRTKQALQNIAQLAQTKKEQGQALEL